MSSNFVITAIGNDQPGLVEQLSSVIRAHEGNWLESSMANLAGKFAGIVQASVPDNQASALKAALEALPQLRVVVEISQEAHAPSRKKLMRLSLVGHDRLGIVQEVTSVLARYAVNVEELATRTSSAPMSGETLFHADARLGVGESVDTRDLQGALEALSNELFVEMSLAED